MISMSHLHMMEECVIDNLLHSQVRLWKYCLNPLSS
jgi:hypothetical protein